MTGLIHIIARQSDGTVDQFGCSFFDIICVSVKNNVGVYCNVHTCNISMPQCHQLDVNRNVIRLFKNDSTAWIFYIDDRFNKWVHNYQAVVWFRRSSFSSDWCGGGASSCRHMSIRAERRDEIRSFLCSQLFLSQNLCRSTSLSASDILEIGTPCQLQGKPSPANWGLIW